MTYAGISMNSVRNIVRAFESLSLPNNIKIQFIPHSKHKARHYKDQSASSCIDKCWLVFPRIEHEGKEQRGGRMQSCLFEFLLDNTHTHTHTHIYIQGVPGGMDKTSGGCSLC